MARPASRIWESNWKRKQCALGGVSHLQGPRITVTTTLAHIWNEFLVYLRQGLPHVNLLLGIAIALVGGVLVGSVFGLIAMALVAVTIHILAEAIIPMVLDHAVFVLPALNNSLLHHAISLYIAYFVVIGAIYVARLVLTSGGRPARSGNIASLK